VPRHLTAASGSHPSAPVSGALDAWHTSDAALDAAWTALLEEARAYLDAITP
jgi:hypothetical protein